ncbi:hypothetical protein BVI1335_1540029 [Burkholderia vietnamiensis]|nr:hypothetical protein BVI1335_1540029 [Burkholderia vietnamiensis]
MPMHAHRRRRASNKKSARRGTDTEKLRVATATRVARSAAGVRYGMLIEWPACEVVYRLLTRAMRRAAGHRVLRIDGQRQRSGRWRRPREFVPQRHRQRVGRPRFDGGDQLEATRAVVPQAVAGRHRALVHRALLRAHRCERARERERNHEPHARQ